MTYLSIFCAICVVVLGLLPGMTLSIFGAMFVVVVLGP